MVFSSITFLYLFLPLTLLLHAVAGSRWQNAVLLLFSLVFYGAGEFRHLPLMVLTILLSYGFSRVLERVRHPKRRRGLFLLALGAALAPLLFYKYAGFLLQNLAFFGVSGAPLALPLPLGISFYTFQIVDYLTDVYRGTVRPARTLWDFAAYVTFFPQLIAGPIIRYQDIEDALKKRRAGQEDLREGLSRFLFGLGKKVLLANLLGDFVAQFHATGGPSVLYAWLYALAFTLQIYLDFSAYSDMALGLGRMLGFRFPENFNYPYMATSITDFWRRWHISLGRFFRDYVYLPLGGNRVAKPRWIRNLAVVWLLTGLWHGASWSFVLWGLYFLMLLLLEKLVPRLFQEILPKPLRRLYVLLAVLLGFVLFDAGSLPEAGRHFAMLFGLLDLPLTSPETLYALQNFHRVFLLALFAATPYPRRLLAALSPLKKSRPAHEGLVPLLLLLVLVTAELVDGSFNPFLYFRF